MGHVVPPPHASTVQVSVCLISTYLTFISLCYSPLASFIDPSDVVERLQRHSIKNDDEQ
jgi:hypothetical protein